MQGMKLNSHLRAAALLFACLAGLATWLWRPSDAESSSSIEGIVVDGEGVRLSSATVRAKATAIATVSDAVGHFRLAGPGERVTASKPGYFIGGSSTTDRPLALRLIPIPKEDNGAYGWIDSTPGGSRNCGTCHEEIHREWSGSAHAHSASGRHFRDLYEGTDASGKPGISWGLRTEFPDGAGVCTSCHAPALADRDSARFALGQIRGIASQGVHCDFCHKIARTGDSPPGLTHGSFDLKLLRPSEGQVFFGPLDDVDRGEDVYSPLYRDSRYCASCHEGIVFGVHVYSTYSEWLVSAARRQGKHCQDCHMAPTGKLSNFAPGHGGVEREPRTLASHGLFADSQGTMLRTALKVTSSVRRDSARVRVDIRVLADGVGHRVPTGFLDRHLLLVVDGFDAASRRLMPQSGPRLAAPAGIGLAGHAGRLFGRVRTDFDGRSPAPFWRGGSDPVDTRLVPGVADQSVFSFPAETSRLRVRLLYRRFWQEVIAAKGWQDQDLVVVEQETEVPAPPSMSP
jgi:hypothetical protein